MSDPVVNIYGSAFIYYTCDRDPTSDEPLVYNNYSDLLLFWWNTVTNNFFWCVDTTAENMIWINQINSNNLLSALVSIGLNINTPRSYTTRSTPAFDTSYTPSTTNDTFVVSNVSQTSVLLGSAAVNVVIGGVTIANASLSGVAATQTNSLLFICPANSSYQLTQSVTGVGSSNSILSIRELLL